MKYNYGELESLFEEINELLKYTEENKLTHTNYFMYLASLPNGEKLEYEFSKENIPHLLGINTTYLVTTGLYSSKNSYYVLLEMLEDPYKVFNLEKEGKLDYDRLFSKHIRKKLNCFKRNTNINPKDINMVSRYIPERTYTTTENAEKFDYAIIKKYEDGTIGLLYLAKNKDGIYNPMSSQLLETESEINETLEKILNNQEVTILTGIQTRGYNAYKNYITLDEQIEKISQLQANKKKYNYSVDVSNNCVHFIRMAKNNREMFNQSEESAKQFSQTQEIERIRKELDELRRCKSRLEEQVSILISDNNVLVEKVKNYSENEKQILKILKPEN